MCLGDIARVVEVLDHRAAVAQVRDRLVTVSLLTLDEPVRAGDWLQVHSGLALARLTEDERRDAEQIRHATKEDDR